MLFHTQFNGLPVVVYVVLKLSVGTMLQEIVEVLWEIRVDMLWEGLWFKCEQISDFVFDLVKFIRIGFAVNKGSMSSFLVCCPECCLFFPNHIYQLGKENGGIIFHGGVIRDICCEESGPLFGKEASREVGPSDASLGCGQSLFILGRIGICNQGHVSEPCVNGVK